MDPDEEVTAPGVRRLFDEHSSSSFPQRLRDEDVADVDVVVLDADVAGCVSSWLDGGRLDGGQRQVLRRCARDSYRVLDDLSEASRSLTSGG